MSTATLAEFAPVSLEELNLTAALLTRVDRKYVLDRTAAAGVLADLPASARVLEIDGNRRFRYHSTYFDTPDLAAYMGTARRRRRRYKVRTRAYVDSGGQFLEVKTRLGGATVKRRSPWDGPADLLDDDGLGFVDEALAEGSIHLDGRLDPVLDVEYQRTTLLMPGGNARAHRRHRLDLARPLHGPHPHSPGPRDHRDQVELQPIGGRPGAVAPRPTPSGGLQVRNRPSLAAPPPPPQPLAPDPHPNRTRRGLTTRHDTAKALT